MRGARAKAIRREVYGDRSPLARKYYTKRQPGNLVWSQIVAGPLRRRYQAAKRA